MKDQPKQIPTLVISLGGSLICPDNPDIEYLQSFKSIVRRLTRTHKIIIITGGGRVCREYQDASRQFTTDPTEIDWIGIISTRLNAQLVAALLGYRNPVVTDPRKPLHFSGNIIVAGGWKPGFSSDMDAVLLGKKCNAGLIFNLTNQDHVYTSDPRKNAHAKPLQTITWKEYLHLIGTTWTPGLSTPFDPVASREAQRNRMTVHIIHGKRCNDIIKAINGKPFTGTTISP